MAQRLLKQTYPEQYCAEETKAGVNALRHGEKITVFQAEFFTILQVAKKEVVKNGH